MTPYDTAFDLGHKAAMDGQKRRSCPSFWRGLVSPKYLDQHTKGYQAGYNTGLKDKRHQELYQARHFQNHERQKYSVLQKEK